MCSRCLTAAFSYTHTHAHTMIYPIFLHILQISSNRLKCWAYDKRTGNFVPCQHKMCWKCTHKWTRDTNQAYCWEGKSVEFLPIHTLFTAFSLEMCLSWLNSIISIIFCRTPGFVLDFSIFFFEFFFGVEFESFSNIQHPCCFLLYIFFPNFIR